MPVSAEINDFAARVSGDVKMLNTFINGNTNNLAALTTIQKANLVAALNEIKADVDALSAGAAGIDDATTGTGTTWSSSKVAAEIQAAVAALVNGAPGALDTLNELAAALAADDSEIAALTTAIASKADQAELDALTAAIGDTETDYVAAYNAVRNA